MWGAFQHSMGETSLTSDAESTAPSLPADVASKPIYTIDPIKHLRLAKSIAGKFYRKVNRLVDEADIRGAAYEGLIQGCKTFDPSKGIKPSTYLHKVIRNKIMTVLVKYRGLYRHKHVSISNGVDYDASTSLEDTLAAPLEESNFDPRLRGFIAKWINEIPQEYRQIVYYRFIEQLTCEETAEKLGFSKQRASHMEIRAIEELKRRIGNVE